MNRLLTHCEPGFCQPANNFLQTTQAFQNPPSPNNEQLKDQTIKAASSETLMFRCLSFWVFTLPGNSGLNKVYIYIYLYRVTTLPNKCKNRGGDYYWQGSLHYQPKQRAIIEKFLKHAMHMPCIDPPQMDNLVIPVLLRRGDSPTYLLLPGAFSKD